jgi:hypothetical protein
MPPVLESFAGTADKLRRSGALRRLCARWMPDHSVRSVPAYKKAYVLEGGINGVSHLGGAIYLIA